MATADSTSQNALNAVSTSPPNGPVTNLTISLEKVSFQERDTIGTGPEKHDSPRRRLHVYARPQILHLSKSSLVRRPDGMPALKDWFGDWNEQQVSGKKDLEPAGAVTSTRDRRFRRDADDGELPARPAFRATLSQPSQMGNFRHQSIRTTDRDKDKDTDKERERDIRDKEGAEKLRSLSDKYDRDRLALSANSPLRNKDRDSAPHLNAGSSTRLHQGQGTNGNRRVEGRDSTKRKPGESEDWRRGSESTRNGRDDRSDNGRRDRDNRERPRSRSRLRRDPSATRRDRDRDRDDRARDRKGDDRDEHRRDREDHARRDRDDYLRRDWDDRLRDRDENLRERRDIDGDEDPRRWRDDGKREERLAARRERGWDRWEPSDRTDDRDGRSKRATGRDRRSGAEEGKEKDERREREKEKEPAWMEYDISSPGGAVLGQPPEGELDSIQAFKKDMREKERKEKEGDDAPEPSAKVSPVRASDSPSAGPESGMDEIQLFKLMMKREAEKKDSELSPNGGDPSSPALPVSNSGSVNHLSESKDTSSGERLANSRADAIPTNGSTQNNSSLSIPNEAHSLLSLISAGSPGPNTPQSLAEKQSIDHMDAPQPMVSRFFPNPPGLSSNHSQNLDRSPIEPPSASPASSFNPPQGSRLLAFASRTPGATLGLKMSGIADPLVNNAPSALSSATSTLIPNVSKIVGNDGSPNPGLEYQYTGNPRVTPSEASFASRSYSPFGQQSHSFVFDELPEARLGSNELLRRASGIPPSNQFGSPSEAGSPYQEMVPNGPPFDMSGNPAGPNYAAGKGSRFAKFFDAKREVQPSPGMRRTSAGAGFVSTSPHSGHRQDGGNPENRTMEDIFAMLQNSAQNHRVSPQVGQLNRVPGGGAFGQSHEMQVLQLQQLQQQQQYAHNRMDSLYESRLDDRSFVPDGMVPGLRPAPRPRSREPSGVLYNDHLDDLQYNVQRLSQPQRNLEQMYSGPIYSQHPNQPNVNRNAGIQLQQAQFRGGPSPIQTSMPNPGNRLPPGLANLGARPPHDPTQFMNSPIGASGGLHGGISPNAPAQHGFNNFGVGGNIGFGVNPQARGPLPGHHLQNPLTLNQMAGLGPNASLDLRGQAVTQAQLLGLGGVGGLSGNMRGSNFNTQHGPVGPMSGPHLAALRHQQQQQLPPHLVQQMLPPHLQPQQNIPGGNAQGAQDLMALLMGNHRD